MTEAGRRVGIAATHCWPEVSHLADLAAFNVVLVDADMGYDGQFPWQPGAAPMPVVALIGSEAPGRIAWAMSQGADAHLLKPIGSAGLYSALVIACHSFARRKAMTAEIDALFAMSAVSVLIGPEGGYEPDEVARAKGAGAVIVTMGRRVLRSETAGLVAATLVLEAVGELG